MSVTPRLSRKLHDTLGDEAAEDLVSWMQERESQHGDMLAEMQLGFAKLDARLGELREAIRADIAQRSSDLIKWSFLFWVGAVGAIAALAGVLR